MEENQKGYRDICMLTGIVWKLVRLTTLQMVFLVILSQTPGVVGGGGFQHPVLLFVTVFGITLNVYLELVQIPVGWGTGLDVYSLDCSCEEGRRERESLFESRMDDELAKHAPRLFIRGPLTQYLNLPKKLHIIWDFEIFQ